MIEDVKDAPWWRRPFARMRAWTYYKAVRLFARSYFHFGKQRGREELDALRDGTETKVD